MYINLVRLSAIDQFLLIKTSFCNSGLLMYSVVDDRSMGVTKQGVIMWLEIEILQIPITALK